MRMTEIPKNKPLHQTTDYIVKLRNTKFTWTALILLAFGLLLNLPEIAHTITTYDWDNLGDRAVQEALTSKSSFIRS